MVLSQTIELRVPKDLYVNVWSKKEKPVETVEGPDNVYRWTWSQKKPTVGKGGGRREGAEEETSMDGGTGTGCKAG